MAKRKEIEAPKHPLDQEANQRIDDCRAQKMPFELDMREAYFFTSPLRSRQINSMSAPATTPLHDDGYLQTTIGYELTEDLATEIVNTFMPQSENWCERGPGMFVPDDVWKSVEKDSGDGDKKIFTAMKAGNLYPEIAKAFVPDIAIGTVGLHIDRSSPSGPIHALAVPAREMEINLGPFGEIDDRFIVRFTKNRLVKALLGRDVTIPADLLEQIEGHPNERTELRWGWWRNWENVGDEEWQYVVMIKNRVVHSATLKGEGCCQFIVMRFGATSDWAWALGVLLKSLPELRQVDELEGQRVQHIELNLTPPIGYPDDSMAAIENGLEAGMAYPVRVGSGDAIKRLYDPGSPEVGIYAIDDKIKRLRKMWYIDYPEQSGDTPPTLGQWLDERARAQRRIGTPGMPFFQEGPVKIFLRFKYLLEQAGAIKKLEGKNGAAVATQPRNPAQRASEQQEIADAVRFIQICGQAFPEEFKAFVDGKASMEAFVEIMRVKLVKFREPDQVAAAIKQITPLLSPRGIPNATAQPAQGVQ